MLLLVERLGGVKYHQHERGIGERFPAAGNAELLGLFESLAQASRIYQLQGDSIERNSFSDQVAGGSRLRGNDGSLALDQAVEELTFSRIGAADDSHGEPVMNDSATGEGGFKRLEWGGNLTDAAGDLG